MGALLGAAIFAWAAVVGPSPGLEFARRASPAARLAVRSAARHTHHFRPPLRPLPRRWLRPFRR
ncbi:MAG: hypothetical protein INH41_05735 [Myxococcaceae bacterium]|nr:hypothetical protein [Myxococcaceae bacterium]MCA3011887.1 hypothetical protein [Myxococcaceae bacterium]